MLATWTQVRDAQVAMTAPGAAHASRVCAALESPVAAMQIAAPARVAMQAVYACLCPRIGALKRAIALPIAYVSSIGAERSMLSAMETLIAAQAAAASTTHAGLFVPPMSSARPENASPVIATLRCNVTRCMTASLGLHASRGDAHSGAWMRANAERMSSARAASVCPTSRRALSVRAMPTARLDTLV